MQKTLLILIALLAVLFASDGVALADAYGTFECMGVVADLPAGQTVNTISEVRVYIDDSGSWKRVQNAVLVGSQNFYASSVFGLAADTAYDFKVEFYDLSHDLVDTRYMTGSTRPEPVIPSTAAQLYVSPSGSDSAAGTFVAPFATLGHALAVASPGTTIYLRAGTYYNTEVYPTVNASQSSPIVIRSYGGEEVVLDGADPSLVDTAWTSVQPQVYRHAFTGDSRNVCLRRKSDGTVFRAYMMATAAEVTSQTSTGYTFAQLNIDAAFCADGANITVRVPSGQISDYEVYVAASNTAVYLENRSHFYFDGITFTHYGAGDYNRVMYILSSSDVLIQNCRFLYNNAHIWVKNNSNRVTIQDNVCVDDTADWHFEYTKSMAVNYSGEVETGLVIVGGTYSGRGLVIRRNTITGTFDGSEIAPYTSYTGPTTAETDFYDNQIRHVADDFLEVDGFARNYRLFRNYMRESLSGISLAQALDGPTWIVRNTIADCGMCFAAQVETWEGYPFKTNGGPYPDVGSGQVFFYHNTAYTLDPYGGAVLIKNAKWKKLTFRNNIWCGRARGFESWTSPLSPWDWDYDVLFREAGQYAKIGTGGSALYYSDIAALRAGTGYLLNGSDENPLLADVVAGDYSLTQSSPCVDRGVLLPGINEDFAGSAPDIGAYELGGPNPADTDGDGLPDDWEIEHFGDLDETASGDPDGDGVSNIDEFTAGTDPTQADVAGPLVSSVASIPAVVRQGVDESITVSASADDSSRGNSKVLAAECFVGADQGAGRGLPMAPADGSFDSPVESLLATLDTRAWTGTSYRIYLRARDAAGFWGPVASILVSVVDGVAPAAVSDLAVEPALAFEQVATDDWYTLGAPARADEQKIIDLGSPVTVGAVSLTVDAPTLLFPLDFSIFTSLDASDWRPVARARAFKTVRGSHMWFFEPESARYIMITALSRLDRNDRLFRVRIPQIAVYKTLDGNAMRARWTATADDASAPASGPASDYDLRFSSSPITAAGFESCSQVPSVFSPSAPGHKEQILFNVGPSSGTVFVALKVGDEVPNWSPLSNLASADPSTAGLKSVWPSDGYSVIPGVVLQFSYLRGADVRPAFIAFSDSPDFPARPVTNPDGLKSFTKRFPLKPRVSYWKPSASQWKSVMTLAGLNGTVYWRLEGSNPSFKGMYGPVRSIFFDTGSISSLSVIPVHDLSGDDGIWPDAAVPPAFSWTDNTKGMRYFFVDVSTDPALPLGDRKITLTLGRGVVAGPSLAASTVEWQKIRKLASGSGGVLYWRVRATDALRALVCAGPARKLVVDGGSWTLSPLDLVDPAPPVTWTHVGEGLVNFKLQISANPLFPGIGRETVYVPLRAAPIFEYSLSPAEVLRLKSLAARNGVPSLYYRVIGEDLDRKFISASPSQTADLP